MIGDEVRGHFTLLLLLTAKNIYARQIYRRYLHIFALSRTGDPQAWAFLHISGSYTYAKNSNLVWSNLKRANRTWVNFSPSILPGQFAIELD